LFEDSKIGSQQRFAQEDQMSSTVSVATAAQPHVSAPTTRLRLTARGRAVFTTLAAVPLVIGALAIALNGGSALASAPGGGSATFTYVTVASGQSLWELAEAIAPTADPRDVIADIVNLNQLQSEDVQPGQRLALPATF
jgi:LysM repeat protein